MGHFSQEDKNIQMIEFLLFGDDELSSVLSKSRRDISFEIKRVTGGVDDISGCLRTGIEVCEECTEEYESFEQDIDSAHHDIETNVGDLINEIKNLNNDIDSLERIIRDLVSFATDYIPEEEIN